MSAISSTDFIDTTIANLKVISMIPKNGKICIKKGKLCLDNNKHPTQCVRRWINGDNRELALLHIKNTIANAMNIASMLKDDPSKMMGQWTIQRIMEEMIACEAGLENLKTTYNEDSMMMANLDVIIERQQANRAELQTYLAGG